MKNFLKILILTSFVITVFISNSYSVPIPRIISTYRPASYLIFALDLQKFIVGVPSKNDNMGLFLKLLPNQNEFTEVGTKSRGVNIETIIGLKPTIVLLFPNNEGINIGNKLKAFNITTELIQIESILDIQGSLIKLGKIFNVEQKAQNTINEMNRILSIAEKNVPIKVSKKPRIYFSSTNSFLSTHSISMLQHEMIKKSGCEDVVDVSNSGWVNVSPEQLLNWNPDIIITSSMANYESKNIIEDKRFSIIKAVKNNNIYQMPDKQISSWDYPSPDSVLGVLWMSKICYPKEFANVNMDSEIKKFYLNVYGVKF